MRDNALRLSLIQDNPVVGDITHNVLKVKDALRAERDSDLIVFSECFVTGYPLNDLVLRPGFLNAVDEAIADIRKAVIEQNGPAVLVGAPEVGSPLPYNSAFLIEPDGNIRVVRKCELPNSDVFDERRTFSMAAASEAKPLAFRGFNLGIQICEDMWHGPVTRSLAEEGADVLLVINGSPYQRGKQDVRVRHAETRVRMSGLPLIYVNQVGGQDELVFDGNSFVMNTNKGVMSAAMFRPDVLRVDLTHGDGFDVTDTGVFIHAVNEFDVPETLPAVGEDYAACVLGLRDYVAKTGSARVYLGVSGGLDSALVLAMAADALGADRVVGVMMPSRHTGQESLDLAADLMSRLGVHAMTLPITDTYDAVNAALTQTADTLSETLGVEANHAIARENYQARLRGLSLMGLANALGGIVLSTGNKSEMAVGYATLYGDMAGGFNPLKSVYKSDAFEMARWRNACDPQTLGFSGTTNPIPEGIITRPPTAELAEGQTDQKSLGSYEVLDALLRCLIEKSMSPAASARHLRAVFGDTDRSAETAGFSFEDYADVIARKVRSAQYKRMQAPPGVKLNVTDFGLGWRYPIAGTYGL